MIVYVVELDVDTALANEYPSRPRAFWDRVRARRGPLQAPG